jgi:subtilase family serine protease
VRRGLPALIAGAALLGLALPGTAVAAQLPLIFPLTANDAGLQRYAAAVSTPGSPEYGRYESVSVLARRFGAGARARAAVIRYLRSVGASDVQVSPTGMFVQARMSVGLAERTFAARLHRLRSANGQSYLAPDAPARLPGGLRGSALGVVGLDSRPLVAPRAQPPSGYRPASGTPSGCSSGVRTGGFTPNQYLSAYGYESLHRAGLRGQGQRVALIEIDGFKRSDVTTFARCFNLRLPPIVAYGVATPRPLPPGPEATLDLEMLDAAAPRARSFDVFESAGNAVGVDKAFAAPLVQPGTKPQVISASLGLCEPAMAQTFGATGLISVERSLELAAATGISTVVAAGDNGSADCVDQQGNVVDALAVDYPGVSPWVTAVGGTNLHLDGSNQLLAETVWNDTSRELAAGGGGLSLLFFRPRFQNGVVPPNRRAVPDVSMLADIAPGDAFFCTADQAGCTGWRTVGGTSAAAPLLGGGLAIVDQDLRRHGREVLGLADPLLYSLGRSAVPGIFNDVTQGGNDVGPYVPGGDGRPLGCCQAGRGFDWASGWGSLDLGGFDRAALTRLPRVSRVSIRVPRPQQPVRAGGLALELACSARCTAYAFGTVGIGGGPTLQLRSTRYHLARKGVKRILIPFTRRQESRLRAALAHDRQVVAELFGADLDPAGKLGDVTSGVTYAIRR